MGLGDHELRLWCEMGGEGCRLKGKPIEAEGHIIQILIKSRVQAADSLIVWLFGCLVVKLPGEGIDNVEHGIRTELE